MKISSGQAFSIHTIGKPKARKEDKIKSIKNRGLKKDHLKSLLLHRGKID
jgi:hypothetical protein